MGLMKKMEKDVISLNMEWVVSSHMETKTLLDPGRECLNGMIEAGKNVSVCGYT